MREGKMVRQKQERGEVKTREVREGEVEGCDYGVTALAAL